MLGAWIDPWSLNCICELNIYWNSIKLHKPVTYKFSFDSESKKCFFPVGEYCKRKTGGKILKIAIFREFFLPFFPWRRFKDGKNFHKCKNMQFLVKKAKVFLSGVIFNDKNGRKMLKNCYFSEFCSFLHVLWGLQSLNSLQSSRLEGSLYWTSFIVLFFFS